MIDDAQRLCELEKENRRLQKKLQRSEANQIDQEKRNDAKEAMLRGVIQDLQRSQAAVQASHEQLQRQAEELEAALIELKRTQAQLIQSEKMSSLGQLVAGVAHEINNPVGFVSGNLDYAELYIKDLVAVVRSYQKHFSHCPPPLEHDLAEIDLEFTLEDLTRLLQSMRVGCERIREIVVSLRSFSRLDEAELKPVDLHAGIESTLLILQSRLKANADRAEIRIRRNYSELPQVECYAGQLNQVFMNILSNAIDALEEQAIVAAADWQPTLTIQTEMNCSTLKIRIADNGTGVPEAIRSRLFDPFFTTKDIGKGTGLGLSISYQIVVDRHKGQLSCRSTLGEGAEFLIEIPARCTKKAAHDRAA